MSQLKNEWFATLDTNECFTSISFESHHINGRNFTIDGTRTDGMIWGGNGEDHFVGYHGRCNRARFRIEWSTAMVNFFGEEEDNVDETPSTSGGNTNNGINFCVLPYFLKPKFFIDTQWQNNSSAPAQQQSCCYYHGLDAVHRFL
jgi:hypothetical protein